MAASGNVLRFAAGNALQTPNQGGPTVIRLPGTFSRIAVATLLLGLSSAAPLHAAAPRIDGKRILRSPRVERAVPRFHFVPGQPARFPRELLPELLREFDAEIEEPGEEPAREPRDWSGLEHGSRPIVGTNRLINDPSGDPPGSTQSENTIAAHGNELVAGWNESFDPGGRPRSFSGYGYSSDGGRTWTDGGTLPHADTTDFTVGDPCLTVDDDGNFYYASLYSPDGQVLGVSVSRGRFRNRSFSFGLPVMAGVPRADDDGLDKEWIAADPDNGRLYLTYTRFFLTGASQIELVRSKDKGRTWSSPVVLSDSRTESVQGARPVVGSNHEVYVVYSAVDLRDFTFHMRIRKSTNEGKRFGSAVNVGERRGDHGLYPNVVTGPPGFNRPSGVELPSIAVDRSSGHDRGRVYVTWPEAVNYFEDDLGGAGVSVESENNDSALVATRFGLGGTLVGALGTATDPDWYSFTGRAGQTVEFFLTPAQGDSTEGYLRLFCRQGGTADRLAFSSFGGGQAFVVFTLPSDGTYFVRVLAINPTANAGGYYLFTGVHVRRPGEVARDSRDVVLARSEDGVRWSRRAIVNHDAPGYDNAFPEVAVDSRGDVHVVWYDHRNDSRFGILTDLYWSRSRDDGERFDADLKVNDGPSTNWNLTPSRLAPNMGDYIALTADRGSVYANWADGRLGSPDSWMAELGSERRRPLVAADDEGADVAATGGRIALRAVNPAHRGTPVAVGFDLPRAGSVSLDVYSVTGQRVRTLWAGPVRAGSHRIEWDTRGRDGEVVSPGIYFVVLATAERRVSRSLALLE
jgi:hypothetical protein